MQQTKQIKTRRFKPRSEGYKKVSKRKNKKVTKNFKNISVPVKKDKQSRLQKQLVS